MNLSRFTAPRMVRAPEGEGGSGEGGEGAAAAAAPAAPDLSFLGDDYKTDSGYDLDKFRTNYEELVARDAINSERLADVPEDANGYEFALPEDIDFGDLELPEDFSVDLIVDDAAMAPLFEGLGGFLHKHGIPKSATGEIMGLLAKYEATKFSAFDSNRRAELAALGNPSARQNTVMRALESKLPADLASALRPITQTAGGIKALERLLAPRSMASAQPQPSTVDVDNMNPRQMLREANRRAMGGAA